MADYIDYRLALIIPQTHQLLGVYEDGACHLPTFSIPLWERPAEQLTTLIEEKWNIKTLLLDVLLDESIATPCAVIEVRTQTWQFVQDGFNTVCLDNLSNRSLGESERVALHSILDGGDAGRGPFSRIGWIEEAQSWIQVAVKDHEVRFTEDVRHFNAGGNFCLLRLGTRSGPAYWLKAVGIPNEREFAVTTYLATHCPQYLPPIVAVREDWNAWLMEEFGSSLHHSTSLGDFERAVHSLAHLQKQLAGKSEDLLNVLCGDHRMGTIRSHIDEVMEYLDEAMRQQTSVKVPALASSRLREIGSLLHEACYALEQLRIPDSLMHNDISPGSILSNGRDCVFTDWCEAYVGNPFITLEQICVHIARKTDESESWTARLKSVYKSCWAEVLTEHQIDRAFQLAPLISVLSYLYGRGDWLHSPRRAQASFLSYSRSLARHMDRIARNPALGEALCIAS